MRQIKELTYGANISQSIKYLQVTIQCLEPKIFNVKVEVLFYKLEKIEYNLNFLIKYLRF